MSRDLVQAAFNVGEGVCVLDIVQIHHFVFDVEIQLAAQKSAQIFMDKVIRAVFGGVVGQVFFQQGAVGVFVGRGFFPNGIPRFAD